MFFTGTEEVLGEDSPGSARVRCENLNPPQDGIYAHLHVSLTSNGGLAHRSVTIESDTQYLSGRF